MSGIDLFLAAIGLYAICGVVFALVFVWAGVVRMDPAVGDSPRMVRVLFVPGIAGLWPVMLVKWIRASGGEQS